MPPLIAGDLGYSDSAGNYFVVDRLKELIKVGGHVPMDADASQPLHAAACVRALVSTSESSPCKVAHQRRSPPVPQLCPSYRIHIHTQLIAFNQRVQVKGFQCAPAELEGHLLSHPGVMDAGWCSAC